MLTAEQRAAFDVTGVCKIEGAFGANDAARMRDVVWRELHRRYEIDRDAPSTWNNHPATGLKTSKRSSEFAPILGPCLRGVLDDVFGVDQWVKPKHYGQVLVTMPNAQEWRVPSRLWHADFQYYGRYAPVFAVKCWALFDDVDPGGGGTPQLAGSHKLVARYIAGCSDEALEYKRVRDGFLRSHPWLKALTTDDQDADRTARFMEADADVDGLSARVIECTGRAGDVYITHPWVMHSIAPNALGRPRFMRSMAIYRTVA
jgi:hypothetical protein